MNLIHFPVGPPDLQPSHWARWAKAAAKHLDPGVIFEYLRLSAIYDAPMSNQDLDYMGELLAPLGALAVDPQWEDAPTRIELSRMVRLAMLGHREFLTLKLEAVQAAAKNKSTISPQDQMIEEGEWHG